VKVRGYRIEPGDIEAALVKHPLIEQAIVVVSGMGIEAPIVAFVITSGGRTPSLLEIKRHCAEHLPHYMIIDRIHALEAFPRTRNGKIDRLALSTLPDRNMNQVSSFVKKQAHPVEDHVGG
jgi:acyl-coenzyme A synthetase/AMP-(fatty) acid ligase